MNFILKKHGCGEFNHCIKTLRTDRYLKKKAYYTFICQNCLLTEKLYINKY